VTSGSEATVYRWIAQEEVDLGERPGTRSGEHVELSKANARIRGARSGAGADAEGLGLVQRGGGATHPKRVYPVIASLAGQGHSAKASCRMLGVAPSGFFYWQSRPPTMLELRTEQLGALSPISTMPPKAPMAPGE
jgi:hypothetical protein